MIEQCKNNYHWLEHRKWPKLKSKGFPKIVIKDMYFERNFFNHYICNKHQIHLHMIHLAFHLWLNILPYNSIQFQLMAIKEFKSVIKLTQYSMFHFLSLPYIHHSAKKIMKSGSIWIVTRIIEYSTGNRITWKIGMAFPVLPLTVSTFFSCVFPKWNRITMNINQIIIFFSAKNSMLLLPWNSVTTMNKKRKLAL